MKATRFVIGLSVWIFVMGPFLALGKLSYDQRHLDFWSKMFRNVDMPFPLLSRLLWAFGPLDWWSFITPVALAVAVAAVPRRPWSGAVLAWVLISCVIQFLALAAAFKPYAMLTAVMGYPLPAPYPLVPLLANVSLAGAAIGLAAWSLAAARRRRASDPGAHRSL